MSEEIKNYEITRDNGSAFGIDGFIMPDVDTYWEKLQPQEIIFLLERGDYKNSPKAKALAESIRDFKNFLDKRLEPSGAVDDWEEAIEQDLINILDPENLKDENSVEFQAWKNFLLIFSFLMESLKNNDLVKKELELSSPDGNALPEDRLKNLNWQVPKFIKEDLKKFQKEKILLWQGDFEGIKSEFLEASIQLFLNYLKDVFFNGKIDPKEIHKLFESILPHGSMVDGQDIENFSPAILAVVDEMPDKIDHVLGEGDVEKKLSEEEKLNLRKYLDNGFVVLAMKDTSENVENVLFGLPYLLKEHRDVSAEEIYYAYLYLTKKLKNTEDDLEKKFLQRQIDIIREIFPEDKSEFRDGQIYDISKEREQITKIKKSIIFNIPPLLTGKISDLGFMDKVKPRSLNDFGVLYSNDMTEQEAFNKLRKELPPQILARQFADYFKLLTEENAVRFWEEIKNLDCTVMPGNKLLDELRALNLSFLEIKELFDYADLLKNPEKIKDKENLNLAKFKVFKIFCDLIHGENLKLPMYYLKQFEYGVTGKEFNKKSLAELENDPTSERFDFDFLNFPFKSMDGEEVSLHVLTGYYCFLVSKNENMESRGIDLGSVRQEIQFLKKIIRAKDLKDGDNGRAIFIKIDYTGSDLYLESLIEPFKNIETYPESVLKDSEKNTATLREIIESRDNDMVLHYLYYEKGENFETKKYYSRYSILSNLIRERTKNLKISDLDLDDDLLKAIYPKSQKRDKNISNLLHSLDDSFLIHDIIKNGWDDGVREQLKIKAINYKKVLTALSKIIDLDEAIDLKPLRENYEEFFYFSKVLELGDVARIIFDQKGSDFIPTVRENFPNKEYDVLFETNEKNTKKISLERKGSSGNKIYLTNLNGALGFEVEGHFVKFETGQEHFLKLWNIEADDFKEENLVSDSEITVWKLGTILDHFAEELLKQVKLSRQLEKNPNNLELKSRVNNLKRKNKIIEDVLKGSLNIPSLSSLESAHDCFLKMVKGLKVTDVKFGFQIEGLRTRLYEVKRKKGFEKRYLDKEIEIKPLRESYDKFFVGEGIEIDEVQDQIFIRYRGRNENKRMLPNKKYSIIFVKSTKNFFVGNSNIPAIRKDGILYFDVNGEKIKHLGATALMKLWEDKKEDENPEIIGNELEIEKTINLLKSLEVKDFLSDDPLKLENKEKISIDLLMEYYLVYRIEKDKLGDLYGGLDNLKKEHQPYYEKIIYINRKLKIITDKLLELEPENENGTPKRLGFLQEVTIYIYKFLKVLELTGLDFNFRLRAAGTDLKTREEVENHLKKLVGEYKSAIKDFKKKNNINEIALDLDQKDLGYQRLLGLEKFYEAQKDFQKNGYLPKDSWAAFYPELKDRLKFETYNFTINLEKKSVDDEIFIQMPEKIGSNEIIEMIKNSKHNIKIINIKYLYGEDLNYENQGGGRTYCIDKTGRDGLKLKETLMAMLLSFEASEGKDILFKNKRITVSRSGKKDDELRYSITTKVDDKGFMVIDIKTLVEALKEGEL